MANISFAKPPPPATKPSAQEVEVLTPEVEHPDNTPTKAVAVVEAKPLAVSAPAPAVSEGVEGEVSRSDIKLPRINLVQRVGNLANDFTPGSILFEKQVVLTDGKTPFDLTPLRIRKQFQRKVAWGEGDGEAPEVYDTVAEVRAAGGSLEFGDENYFQEIAHIMCAVALPRHFLGNELTDAAGIIDMFPFRHNDELYAVAMWTVSSSAYTALAKRIFTDAAGLLRNGIYGGHYQVTSELKKNARNSWYAPKVKFAGKHTADATAFFKEIGGL